MMHTHRQGAISNKQNHQVTQGNWKQWKRKPEMENGKQKWSKLDGNECHGKP